MLMMLVSGSHQLTRVSGDAAGSSILKNHSKVILTHRQNKEQLVQMDSFILWMKTLKSFSNLAARWNHLGSFKNLEYLGLTPRDYNLLMWGCGLRRRWGACFFLIGCRRSVVSSSLRPCGLQHSRLRCPLLSPGVCLDSCLLSQWCHPTISHSLSLHFSSCLQSFPASESFPVSWLSWLKYWSFSFSISLSNEYSGLISFRIDWFGLFAVQGTLESLLQHHRWF